MLQIFRNMHPFLFFVFCIRTTTQEAKVIKMHRSVSRILHHISSVTALHRIDNNLTENITGAELVEYNTTHFTNPSCNITHILLFHIFYYCYGFFLLFILFFFSFYFRIMRLAKRPIIVPII